MHAVSKFDVDFSLALFNRTGKFFIGRDIIRDQADLIENVRYWRLKSAKVPRGLSARLLGRSEAIERKMRIQGRLGARSLLRNKRPVIHLDPASVAYSHLKPSDVILCHDLGPISHPNLFKADVTDLYRDVYRTIAEVSPRLVFVSRASRAAFVESFGAVPNSAVIYPPLRGELTSIASTPVDGLKQPFLLTVGSVGSRKNQEASIRAFAHSKLAEQGWTYVICGGREPGADAVVARAQETTGVKLLSYVTDGQLKWLYSNASGFVLASLLEGFGVPVAEAIAYDLVPIVSRGSVLEEVAGEGAISVDPADVADMARGMRNLAEMSVDERHRRQSSLSVSISRFSATSFERDWRRFLAGQE